MHFILTVRVALRGFGEVTSICFYSVSHRIVTNRLRQNSGYVSIQLIHFDAGTCPKNCYKFINNLFAADAVCSCIKQIFVLVAKKNLFQNSDELIETGFLGAIQQTPLLQ